jgi:hypothetical protein
MENSLERRLLVNAIITPDGTRLESTHRHDYKSYMDLNGEVYMVDGGSDYLRRNINTIPATEACVYTDDSHLTIRETFRWGTRGKDGNQPIQRKILSTLDTDHIKAILETQFHIEDHIKQVFQNELIFRKINVE